MLNDTSLRFPDEFVRHKMLDLLGDFALIGQPVLGRLVANRAGHALAHAIRCGTAGEHVSLGTRSRSRVSVTSGKVGVTRHSRHRQILQPASLLRVSAFAQFHSWSSR